jgi:DNA-binding NarL/FixJ family response regulator
VRVLHPRPFYDATMIPYSFESFYTATVARTLAIALRMTATRQIAYRVTRNAYAVMFMQWDDRQSQSQQENARLIIELTTRMSAGFSIHHDSSSTSVLAVDTDLGQLTDDEFELFWFDVRDDLHELALNVNIPWPRRPEATFSALVANSDQQLRRTIAARLTQIGAATVHEAATLAEAKAHALARGPRDLAILDLEQPDGSGVELVTYLRNRGWRRIIVLTSPDHRYTVPLALQAGAQACLLKPAPLTSSTYNLSNRDVKILQLVAAGHSNKEIGQTLDRSAATIKNHLIRIGRQLGTGNRARMVVHALRAGIIT